MTVTNPQGERARVLIADSAELVRQGIRGVLTRDRQFVVVGEIAGPQEIVKACLERSPEVIFLGLGRGDPERAVGLTALRETLRQDPSALVIVLVDGDSVDDLLVPVQAGASGVLLRDAPAGTLLEAAHHVLEGGCLLDPRLTRKLFEHLASEMTMPTAFHEPKMEFAGLRSLSPREREVLRLLCQGLRNKVIAARLGVTVGTVKTHLRHIFRKLNVDDRTGAVLTALQVRLREAA